jgi:hypothetical protein
MGPQVRASLTQTCAGSTPVRPLLALLLVAVALCYTPALSGPYHFDDRIGIAVDPGAASFAAWWSGATAHVRPLLKASFVLSSGVGDAIGHPAAGHRIVNLAIHLTMVALLAVLGRELARVALPRLPAASARSAALLAAALFGLHPLCTEAVSYVSGRSMALGSLLACACVACWARARHDGSPRWLAASVLLAVLAATSRETVVFSLMLLVPSWELLRQRTTAHASAARSAALAATLFAAIAALTALWMLLGHPRYAALLRLSWWIAQVRADDASLLTALQYFVGAAALLRRPSIDPGVSASMAPIERLVALCLLFAAFAAAWRLRSDQRQWLVAALWVLAWLLPLYALPLRHDAVSERHFYPALWGPLWALSVTLVAASGARAATPTRRAVVALALVLLPSLAALTATRNFDYRSEVALWEAAQRTAPYKLRVLNNLGFAYMEAGRWNDAIPVLQRATALYPHDDTVRWNLAAAQARDLRVLDWPALPPWR